MWFEVAKVIVSIAVLVFLAMIIGWRLNQRAPRLRPVITDDKLIDSFRVTVAFRCPCGSSLTHIVTYLHESVDCKRCGRQLAIREMRYHRPHPSMQPEVHFSIGYVVPLERLARANIQTAVQ